MCNSQRRSTFRDGCCLFINRERGNEMIIYMEMYRGPVRLKCQQVTEP